MPNATFVLYPKYPIPCEGDDPDTPYVTVQTQDVEETRQQLEYEHGGWVQTWSIE